jgi:Mg2+-importing ATPase
MVDETVLTGESITVYKNENVMPQPAKAFHDAENLCFSGTAVLSGTAKGLVLKTGRNTALGKIVELTTETSKISDFEKGIAGFSNFILKLIAVTLVLMVFGNVLIKGKELNFIEFFLFAIALTISVIPEALPLVTTFSLSQGARKLSANNVIVKRLSSVQDLGSIEVLCSDKTGTLTENRLKMADFHTQDERALLLAGGLASEYSDEARTEPFDIALVDTLNDDERNVLRSAEKLVEMPFNPSLRRNIVQVRSQGREILITRGAPEEVIAVCDGLSESDKNEILSWIRSEGTTGRRTLAVAEKEGRDPKVKPEELMLVTGYKYLGVISFVDPIKESTTRAVSAAEELGVRVIMVTGDSGEVAAAVALEIGLTDSLEKIISGTEWQELEPAEREQALEEINVFYRVSPEQKYLIVSALHDRFMVGFLGEGINDAPALKMAGVSMVVDSAADIAREASDIILTQPGLEVIVEGIREGRKVFANTIKYIKATLISNVGNFFAIAIASFLIDFLPMLPAQILLVNLLSDIPMISISSDSADPHEFINPNKYRVNEIVLIAVILGIISTVDDFLFFGLFYRISPEVLRTNWFIGSILTELTLIFSIRTRDWFFRAPRPSTSLMVLSAAAFGLTLLIPRTSFGQEVFGFVQPSNTHMLQILILVVSYFVVSEVVKVFFYRSQNNIENRGAEKALE